MVFDKWCTDKRAIFANKSCKLLYRKYNGNFTSVTFQNEAKDLYENFLHYVDGIKDVIGSQIPLFEWVIYLNQGFDPEEFDSELEMTESKWKDLIFEGCNNYYS